MLDCAISFKYTLLIRLKDFLSHAAFKSHWKEQFILGVMTADTSGLRLTGKNKHV